MDIKPKGQTTVKVGTSLKVVCETAVPLQLCRVEIPGEDPMILWPGQDAEGGIEYYGLGLERGQCGAYISKVEQRHNGTFKCSVVPKNNRREYEAKLDITIASEFYFYYYIMFQLHFCNYFSSERSIMMEYMFFIIIV